MLDDELQLRHDDGKFALTGAKHGHWEVRIAKMRRRTARLQQTSSSASVVAELSGARLDLERQRRCRNDGVLPMCCHNDLLSTGVLAVANQRLYTCHARAAGTCTFPCLVRHSHPPVLKQMSVRTCLYSNSSLNSMGFSIDVLCMAACPLSNGTYVSCMS